MSAVARSHSAGDAMRKARVRLIHVLARECKLIEAGDDHAYREVIRSVTAGAHSSTTACTLGQLDAIVDRLKGSSSTSKAAKPAYPGRPHNADAIGRRELTKVEALLTDAGLPWSYAEAILKTQTRGAKTRMALCSPRELIGVLTALERAALRRLQPAVLAAAARLGQDWAWCEATAHAHCGLGEHAELARSTQCMSLLLRHLAGPASLPLPPGEGRGEGLSEPGDPAE